MRILTFALCLLCFSVSAQNNSINVYPWNPDSDNDNQIGVDDLQSFLTVYGNSFGLPPEPCTYDGTPLEELLTGVHNGDIMLDSIFVEYQLEDVSTYYPIGCPEQVSDTLIITYSIILQNLWHHGNYWRFYGGGSDNFHQFSFHPNPTSGEYYLGISNKIIISNGFASDGFFGGSEYAETSSTSIPFPTDWYLDEEGIHIESGWDEGDWVYYANYLHILPYWHYADE